MDAGKHKKESVKEPKVSVIIPAWNVEGYVGKTLDSILRQSFREFEIIFVDDGSSDATPLIAKEKLREASVRVAFISQENRGVSAARNAGFLKARGEYVMFFDADDLMEPTCLEKLYTYALAEDLDIVFCGFKVYHEKEKREESGKNKISYPGRPRTGKAVLLDNWKGKTHLHTCTMMYRKAFLEQNKILYDERYLRGEDLDYRWRSLCLAERVMGIPEELVVYVVWPGSSVRREFPNGASGQKTPFERRFDVLSFRPFLERQGDQKLIAYFNGHFAPLLTIRRLRTMILQQHEKKFWEARRDPAVMECLSQAWKSLCSKPEVFVKSMMVFYFPGLFLRRYRSERKRDFFSSG